MSALAGLWLAAAAASSPGADAAKAAEIAVIAERMRRGVIKTTSSASGVRNCRVIRSTGDPEIDPIGCAAMQRCDEANAATPAAIFDPANPRRARNTQLRAYRRDVQTPCYLAERDRMRAALAWARAGR